MTVNSKILKLGLNLNETFPFKEKPTSWDGNITEESIFEFVIYPQEKDKNEVFNKHQNFH